MLAGHRCAWDVTMSTHSRPHNSWCSGIIPVTHRNRLRLQEAIYTATQSYSDGVVGARRSKGILRALPHASDLGSGGRTGTLNCHISQKVRNPHHARVLMTLHDHGHIPVAVSWQDDDMSQWPSAGRFSKQTFPAGRRGHRTPPTTLVAAPTHGPGAAACQGGREEGGELVGAKATEAPFSNKRPSRAAGGLGFGPAPGCTPVFAFLRGSEQKRLMRPHHASHILCVLTDTPSGS